MHMDSKTGKPILLISPLPPPFGGIAIWTRVLLQLGLPDASPFSLVNTRLRGKRNIFDQSRFSFAEITRTCHVFSRLISQLFFNKPKLIHLNCALSPTGVLRDLACARLAALFNVPVITQFHGHLPDFNGAKCFGLSGRALRRLMATSSLNILTNQLSLEKARQLSDSARFTLLPNFIEDETFQYQKVQTVFPRCQTIFAGGITSAKGCQEILAVAYSFIRQNPCRHAG